MENNKKLMDLLKEEGFSMDLPKPVISENNSAIQIGTKGEIISHCVPIRIESSAFEESPDERMMSLNKLSEDLERTSSPGSSRYSDVTLKCGDVSIPAHKIILFARSPVFAAMFESPMEESLKNEVDITDLDEPVLRALLTYMYSGKTSNLTASLAADLLYASDKYLLPGLKSVCSCFLKKNLSPQNVWCMLVLGDMYDQDLKSFVVDYITNRCDVFSVLEDTNHWKVLRKERPDLVIDVLSSLVKHQEKKLRRFDISKSSFGYTYKERHHSAQDILRQFSSRMEMPTKIVCISSDANN